jgi:hypothetical protein
MLRHPEAGDLVVGVVEAAREPREPVAAAAAPDHEPAEALGDQRLEHVLEEPLERLLPQVDVPAVAAMLRGRPERRRREDERDTASRLEPIGDRLAQLLDEPGVEVDSKVRALLLRAARRHEHDRLVTVEAVQLFVREAPEQRHAVARL